MRLSVGDKIIGFHPQNKGIVKEILEVREKGYTWGYLDIPDKVFWSENSTDPFFEWGWRKATDIEILNYNLDHEGEEQG